MASGILTIYIRNFYLLHLYFMLFITISLKLSSVTSSTSSNKHNLNYVRNHNKDEKMMKTEGLATNQIADDHNHHPEQMMDSKFDFHFNWDEEPPQFISQLDLEVKWEDEEGEGEKKKVSIHNVTMNQDYDITVPMTKLITSIANTSFHEDRQKNMVNNNNNNNSSVLNAVTENSNKFNNAFKFDDAGECSCSEIQTIIKDLQNSVKTNVGQKKDGRKGLGRKRAKGEKGQKGEPGLTIVGPKGEPGTVMLPYHLMHPERLKGEPGLPGPKGEPGHCSASCPTSRNMEPASLRNPRPDRATSSTPHKHHYRIVPGALVFKSLPQMFQMSSFVMSGSVVFIEESEGFYGKVKGGWRKFQMGPLETH